MKSKRIITTLLITACVALNAIAQVDIDFSKRLGDAINNQDFSKKSISGVLQVIKQSYQIKNKKTGKVYGRGGRDNFGHNYTIAIKTEAGLILPDAALKPWEGDKNFKNFENEYDAVISFTEIRNVDIENQGTFTQYPLHISKQQLDGIWIANSSDVEKNAMEIDVTDGKKEGWLVWVVADKSLDGSSDAVLSLQVSSKSIDVDGNDIQIEAPGKSKYVLGGCYLCPYYEGGGHITYKLVGMVVGEANGWKLITPFVDMAIDNVVLEEVEESIEEVQEEDIKLTPIEKKTKKSKK